MFKLLLASYLFRDLIKELLKPTFKYLGYELKSSVQSSIEGALYRMRNARRKSKNDVCSIGGVSPGLPTFVIFCEGSTEALFFADRVGRSRTYWVS